MSPVVEIEPTTSYWIWAVTTHHCWSSKCTNLRLDTGCLTWLQLNMAVWLLVPLSTWNHNIFESESSQATQPNCEVCGYDLTYVRVNNIVYTNFNIIPVCAETDVQNKRNNTTGLAAKFPNYFSSHRSLPPLGKWSNHCRRSGRTDQWIAASFKLWTIQIGPRHGYAMFYKIANFAGPLITLRLVFPCHFCIVKCPLLAPRVLADWRHCIPIGKKIQSALLDFASLSRGFHFA